MKKISYTFIGFLVAIALGTAGYAHANPSFFTSGVRTNSSASSTPSFMTPGTGTSTTPVYDSYLDGSNQSADSAVLLIQFIGSTTVAQVSTSLEYSQDNIDWYSDRLDNGATTTPTINGTINNSFVFSAQGNTPKAVGGTSSTTLRAFMIKTPTRYIRAVSTLPIGGGSNGNGAVWAQIVPSKEQPE